MAIPSSSSAMTSPVSRGRPSRRAFVGGLGAAGVAAAAGSFLTLGGGTALVKAAAAHSAPPALDHATFARLVGQTFTARHDSGRGVALTLVDVENHGRLALGRGRDKRLLDGTESFTVVFSGPHNQPFAQGTYHVAHPHVGEFPLFIVPMGTPQGGRRYAAVFNLMPRSTRLAWRPAAGAAE